MSYVLGIDPGTKGGLCVMNREGAIIRRDPFSPGMTHGEFVRTVSFALVQNVAHVYLELVGYMPGDGGQGAFTFGQVDGLIRGVLHAKGYTPINVTSQMWQAAMECLSGGNKNITKRRAMELWPYLKWTHALADAALIAEFGRRRQLEEGPRRI